MDIQILSAIPGRLRLRISRLNYDSNYAAQVDRELKVLRFVTGIRINAPASSITITYDIKTISDTETRKTILEAIEQVDAQIAGAHLIVEKFTPNNVVFLNFDSKSQTSPTEKRDKEIVAESDALLQSEAPPNELSETIQPEPVVSTTSEAPLAISQSEEPWSNEQISSNEEISPLQESVSTSADINANKNNTVTPNANLVGETLKLTNQALVLLLL